MIKNYKQKQNESAAAAVTVVNNLAGTEEKIIAADCVLRKFIHGGNIETGYMTLAGMIADEAGRGYSFTQSIPFNSGECIVVFRK
jgi:hypothetical protein